MKSTRTATSNEPFLQAYNANNKTDLVVAGKTYLAPLALYSKKIKSASEIKDGATIAIPNDPSNAAARFSSSRSRAGLN